MNLRISKSAVYQYILIYLMLVFNGTNLSQQASINAPSTLTLVQVAIIIVFCLYSLHKKAKGTCAYPLILFAFLLVSTVIVRYTAGGVGLQVMLEYGSHIFLVYLAIIANTNKFIERTIKVVTFFAVISIIGYIIQLLSPSILQKLLTSYASIFNDSDWSTGERILINKRVWGIIFFSMREGELQRNIGIFTEPANYQIVLNVTLFMLLFFQKYLSYDLRKIIKVFFLLSIALITTQSTSGYIVYFAILLIYILSNKRNSDSSFAGTLKRNILLLVGIGICLLGIDFLVNNQRSILYTVAISKLIGNNGTFDLNAGSGYYRMVTIESCFNLMIKNPFGVGFDTANMVTKNIVSGAAGGAFITFGAAYGLIPFIVVLLWIFLPVIKNIQMSIPIKILFVFMFLEIGMAQSKVFYPFLISIPLIQYIHDNSNLSQHNIDKEVNYRG